VSFQGNLLVENRNGLIVNTELFEANGTAERDAALIMLEQLPGTQRVTVAGDKGYDPKEFVAECRNMNVTPHVAQNHNRPGGSAIDARTVRHAGYRVSQIKRKRIAESFGWLKTHCAYEKGPASRHLQSRLGLYLRGCGLQLGADAESGSLRSSIRINKGRSVSVQPKTGSRRHKRHSRRGWSEKPSQKN
jgi:hypothetical protein